MQGAGGLVIPPDTYWPEIQRIVDKYGILFASDEVICGFGRTGQWFGCEHYGTPPGLHDHGQGACPLAIYRSAASWWATGSPRC